MEWAVNSLAADSRERAEIVRRRQEAKEKEKKGKTDPKRVEVGEEEEERREEAAQRETREYMDSLCPSNVAPSVRQTVGDYRLSSRSVSADMKVVRLAQVQLQPSPSDGPA